MQKYCNIVKNKLNTLISDMEKNISDFVVDPKRDFVRKSELSFSKTLRFILGMGSQTLGKELVEFYDYDSKMVSVSDGGTAAFTGGSIPCFPRGKLHTGA